MTLEAAPRRIATPDAERRSPLDVAWEAAIRDSYEAFAAPMAGAMLFPKRDGLRAYCAQRALERGPEGLWIEFGVAGGRGCNLFADLLKPRGLRITGFDSFEGLSEDWTGHHNGRPEGSYSRKGALPEVRSNVTLVKGWVDRTLPPFLAENAGPVAFAHMDFDTYTPTKLALEGIADRLRPGSVLLFDELYGYPGWRHHEWKALREVLAPERYRYVGFSVQSVGIEIV
ncbi:MAG: class I SAM-dependent methyltransferase [Shimia sp.]